MKLRSVSISVALALGALLVAGPAPDTPIGAMPIASAAKAKSPIKCPTRIGRFKNRPSDVGVSDDGLQCFYAPIDRRADGGAVRIAVHWSHDTPDDRRRCQSRDPQPMDNAAGGPEDFNSSLDSPSRAARGTYYVTKGKAVNRGQAKAAFDKLLRRAEGQAHPCVPEQEPVKGTGLVCPLVIGDGFVRADWYGDDPAAVQLGLDEGAVKLYSFECAYKHAYQDEGEHVHSGITVSWAEGDPNDPTFTYQCREQDRDSGFLIDRGGGAYPIQTRINNDIAQAGGDATLARLVSAVRARTQLCPGAEAPRGVGASAGEPGSDSAGEGGISIEFGDPADPDQLSPAAQAYAALATAYEDREADIIEMQSQAIDGGSGLDLLDPLGDVDAAHAASAAEFLRDLEAMRSQFPTEAKAEVDALIEASAEQARLWALVTGDHTGTELEDPLALDAAYVQAAAVDAARADADAALQKALGLSSDVEPASGD